MESVVVSQGASTAQSEASPAGASLPDSPLVVIEPRGFWLNLGLRDVWAYRELLYFLTWRDVKVRYKQTVLGVVWVILQPLLTTIILAIFLGKLARVPSNGFPYPVFVCAGLLVWTFFSAAITSGSNSLVGSSHLVTKIYFPRMIVPAAAVGARVVDFVIGFLNLIGLMIYYSVGITKSIVVLPIVMIIVILLALAVGMWAAALNVKYRDVGVVMPVLIQLWMFASPVVYPSKIVPARYAWIYRLNPLTGILDGFRAAVFGQQIDWTALGISTAFTIAVLIYSAYAFRRMEKHFADLL
jgi:lipopolysaccharide transport system permease protein